MGELPKLPTPAEAQKVIDDNMEKVSKLMKSRSENLSPELVKLLRDRAKELEDKGMKKDAGIFYLLSDLVQSMITNWRDHEFILRRAVVWDKAIETMTAGVQGLTMIMKDMLEQMPQESVKIERLKEELAQYKPFLDEARKQIGLETERIKQNVERAKNLDGTTYG